MAARKRQTLSESWKEKIRASYYINRLNDHIEGKIKLDPTQIKAIDILLKKAAPDLKSVEMKADVHQMSHEEWLAQQAEVVKDIN